MKPRVASDDAVEVRGEALRHDHRLAAPFRTADEVRLVGGLPKYLAISALPAWTVWS